MHTLLVILGGLALMLVLYGVACWRGLSLRRAFPAYVLLWAIAAALNLWIGVVRAGYSLAEELPIFVLVLGVPSLIAWLLARRSP